MSQPPQDPPLTEMPLSANAPAWPFIYLMMRSGTAIEKACRILFHVESVVSSTFSEFALDILFGRRPSWTSPRPGNSSAHRWARSVRCFFGRVNVWPCGHLPEANGPMTPLWPCGQWPFEKSPKKNHWLPVHLSEHSLFHFMPRYGDLRTRQKYLNQDECRKPT